MTERTCAVDRCERERHARGWCRKHYSRWTRQGDPHAVKKIPNGEAPETCTVDGCDRPYHARGFCSVHFGRNRYHGDPLAGGHERVVGDDDRRFWSFVEKTDGCWFFGGSMAANGYGRFFTTEGTVAAHRYAYEQVVGPIPEGLDLDHMCHNEDADCPGGWECRHRACVNPDHLDPATRALNMQRAFARTGPS